MKMIRFVFSLFFLSCLLSGKAYTAEMTRPDPTLLQTIYTVEERFRFSVSWLGIEGGELVIALKRDPATENSFCIDVTVKSAGLLAMLYPVEDRFQTFVQGELRLPWRYVLEQHEGKRHNRKETTYDQDTYELQYRRNDEPLKTYTLDGPVHNEFSSFMYMRTLSFPSTGEVVVPTFADQKRHEIVVTLEGHETVASILGARSALMVRPHLTFKGLYEKLGNPDIWLTDDTYRIPLRIKAKIIIGSLVAELIEYQGPHGQVSQGGKTAQ
jgi:hypothetical protein